MGKLVLVRHGQAGFDQPVYDQLSPLGARQMAALGAWWAATGRPIDRVLVGPLVRQRRSYASFEEGYGGGLAEAEDESALVEYAALEMMRQAVPRLVGEDPVVAAAVAAMGQGGDGQRHKERLFQHVARRWVRGELEVTAAVVPFAEFRARVAGLVRRVVAGVGRGATTVAFTSGGVVAAAIGMSLGLDDERTLELSWIVRNASFTELVFDDARLTLLGFNAIPHLTDPGLVTFR